MTTEDARRHVADDLVGKSLMSGTLQQATRLRRDGHEAAPSCRLHGTSTCLATGETMSA